MNREWLKQSVLTAKNDTKPHMIPVGLLVVLIFFIYWPTLPITKIATHTFWGDAMINCYLVNWAQHSLWTNPFAYFDAPIFYPQETTGAFSSINLFVSFLTGPVHFLGNPALSYNVMMYTSVILTGLSMYISTFLLFRNRKAALLAGVIFCCNGDMIWHFMGHPNIVAPIFFPPLVLIAIRLIQEPKWFHAPWFCVCLLGQFLCSWYLGFIALIGLSPLVLFALLKQGRRYPKELGLLLLLGAVTMGIVYVYSMPFQTVSERLGSSRSLANHTMGSADPFSGYFVPSHFEKRNEVILAKWIGQERLPLSRGENSQYYGLSVYFGVFISAIIFLILSIKRKSFQVPVWWWIVLLMMLLGYVLSLGPFYWKINDLTLRRLPGWLMYEYVSPLRFMRVQTRYSVLVVTGLCYLLAYGISRFKPMNESRIGWRGSFLILATIILIIEYRPVSSPDLAWYSSEAYDLVAEHSEINTMATYPINNNVFLMHSTATFPKTSIGYVGGVMNYRYDQFLSRIQSQGLTQSVPLFAASGMEAMMVYGHEEVALAKENSALEELGTVGDGAITLFKINPEKIDSEALKSSENYLASLPEFPPFAVIEGEPKRNENFEFAIDIGKGFNLEYDTIEARKKSGVVPIQSLPISTIDSLMVKMSVTGKGVDYLPSKLYFASDLEPAMSESKSLTVFLPPNGEIQWARFDFEPLQAQYRNHKITTLRVDFSARPYPGQEAQIREIYFDLKN